jgi:hypothetical protein
VCIEEVAEGILSRLTSRPIQSEEWDERWKGEKRKRGRGFDLFASLATAADLLEG